ncbi:MAG: transcription-repair coupling factor [bacterium]
MKKKSYTKFIEADPASFPVVLQDICKKHDKVLVEAPGDAEAASLSRALDCFGLESKVFSPSFLLMERGETDRGTEKEFVSLRENKIRVIITTPLSRRLRLPKQISKQTLELKKGTVVRVEEAVKKLSCFGYKRVPVTENFGEFSIKGDILDIVCKSSQYGFRVEFFDDEIERISKYSTISQKNIREVEFCTAHRLLFCRNLSPEWELYLEKFLEDIPVRDMISVKKAIEDGALDAWGAYSLCSDNFFLEELTEIAVVRWEKMKGLNNYEDRIRLLEKERKKRVEEGAFLPLDVKYSFKEYEKTKEPDFDVSGFFSSAEEIENRHSYWRKPDRKRQKNPLLLLSELSEENAVVLFTENPEKALQLTEKGHIPSLPVDILPDNMEKGVIYILEKSAWFKDEAVMFLRNDNTVFLAASIFKEKISGKSTKNIEEEQLSEEKTSPPFELEELIPGTYVVHYKYGISVFEGTALKKGIDCVKLLYQNDDRLYLPVYNMHMLYKYNWEEGHFPRLSSLRTDYWKRVRSSARRQIEKVAHKLLDLYAERAVNKGFSFNITSNMLKKFENDFPYRETSDQKKSIHEMKADMASSTVTDRLLCGDVGFGKTEVAMRGCVISASENKQSAILVPTTVLALQHFRTFKERFRNMPLKIEMLSRFYSHSKQKKVLKGLQTGTVDIVIGTHRLLSKDVKFKDLGFLVVDEEHRFGVSHKERIKEMKKGVETLSMTATPIPRTLQLSLLGVRDISFIKTPPRERKKVKTHVVEFSEEIIKEAVLREYRRDGQIYFVHNRISSLDDMKQRLETILPELSICTAHGRMEENELEQVMVDFVSKRYDLLLATTLIETGIDIPMVNTIIINRADTFGLAQLYQLRGRVGRWNREASAYFLVPSLRSLSTEASKRLSVIKSHEKLGSGYDVAMADLGIRGGGNILGISQSGKLKGVGYELYLDMLKKRINELRNHEKGIISEPVSLEGDVDALIPENYIEDANMRINFYRTVSAAETEDKLEYLFGTITDMYGPLPKQVQRLFKLSTIKIAATGSGIANIIFRKKGFVLSISEKAVPRNIEKTYKIIEEKKGRFTSSYELFFPDNNLKFVLATVKSLNGCFTVF